MKVLGSSGALLSQTSWSISIHVQYLEFSLEWETTSFSDYLFVYKSGCSGCRPRCLFTAICIELWEQCVGRERKKREISVSEVYCTYGSLSWCLWKQKTRKQMNLVLGRPTHLSSLERNQREEVGFLRKVTGWGLRASRQTLIFFSDFFQRSLSLKTLWISLQKCCCVRFSLASTCWNDVKRFFPLIPLSYLFANL